MERTGQRGAGRRGQRGGARSRETDTNYNPSISLLGDAHRAHFLDELQPIEAATHLQMVREWSVSCPRFMHVLRDIGYGSINDLASIRLDTCLLTAMLERWCPWTNTFHLPVGEMTVTLQDVQLLLGLRIDGDPIIGHNVVGHQRRWETWPNCCEELLGRYPIPGVIYQDPENPTIQTTFTMGHSQTQSIVPLRWLRWMFRLEDYDRLTPAMFIQHIRAYLLYMIGCFLLPDTSGSHVSLQYLPLLEDIHEFGTRSIGSAVLGHMYRELALATDPKRVNMAGCLVLLQLWCWERIHVGRPTLRVPIGLGVNDRSIGHRWVQDREREVAGGNTMTYRDELDALRQSQTQFIPYTNNAIQQLPQICREGNDIWTARVILISWKRVEWHRPDRVMRQFGGIQDLTVKPIEKKFKRLDGRGRADTDWEDHYHKEIAMWDNRRAFLTPIEDYEGDEQRHITAYLNWYTSWASLYLLRLPSSPPETFYPRSPAQRMMTEYIVQSSRLQDPYVGGLGQNPTGMQQSIDDLADLRRRLMDSVVFEITAPAEYEAPPASRERRVGFGRPVSRRSTSTAPRTTEYTQTTDFEFEPQRQSMHVPSSYDATAGTSTYAEPDPSSGWDFYMSLLSGGPSTSQQGVGQSDWMIPGLFPSFETVGQQVSISQPEDQDQHPQPSSMPEENVDEAPIQTDEQLEQRDRHPPDRYTPGSGALPQRKKFRLFGKKK